jgi:hypothetical protein
VIVAPCDEPFRRAETVATTVVDTLPAVALNVAVIEVAPTVTEPGTVNDVELLASFTVAPPLLLSVTVQVLEPPAVRVEGAQASALTVIGVASPIEAVLLVPFIVAVIVAVPSLVKLPADALKLALVAPLPTVTEGGTVTTLLLLASVTEPPPVFERFTVQVPAAPAANVGGVQLSPTKVGACAGVVGGGAAGGGGATEVTPELTVPPVPVKARGWPSKVAPCVFVTPIEALETPPASVTVKVAMTPSAIAVELRPMTRHVYVPDDEAQEMVLPAAAVLAVTEAMFPDEYVRVH